MNKMQCENGHFYDGDIYDECPHCKDNYLKKDKSIKQERESEHRTEKQTDDRRDGNTQNTMSLFFQNVGKSGRKIQDEHVTLRENERVETSDKLSVDKREAQHKEKHYNDSLNTGKNVFEQAAAEGHNDDLQRAISETESVDPDDINTISIYTNRGIEPVVGWLICTRGPHFGMAYKLKDGKNQIGRSARMDINITDDAMISREHTVILYESREKKFYLLMEGAGKVYVNEKILLMPQELQMYDRLEMGDSEFMFVPLCGESFDWSNESK